MRGGRSGCFLPEVATDQGWDAAEFLSQCCQGKAGLPPDAWRQPGTKVFLFTSEKFDR
jgi:AMMECR1 domain-containing protein